MPDTGLQIMKKLDKLKKTYEAIDIEKAVDIAMEVTEKHTICLLSPAASSYGFYKNFEERGDRYKARIREYK